MGIVTKIILIQLVAIIITVLSVVYLTSNNSIADTHINRDSTTVLTNKVKLLLIESNIKIDSLNSKVDSINTTIIYNNSIYVKDTQALTTKDVTYLDSIIFLGTRLARY